MLLSYIYLNANCLQINQFIADSAEDDGNVVNYTNSDDDAAEELECYNDSIQKTIEAQEVLAALEGNGSSATHDLGQLQMQQQVLVRCILEEEKNAKLVESRRLKEELREKQRRAALADSVLLPASNAPRPFDSIIEFWQNYAENIVVPADPPPGNTNDQRPTKKPRGITHPSSSQLRLSQVSSTPSSQPPPS